MCQSADGQSSKEQNYLCKSPSRRILRRLSRSRRYWLLPQCYHAIGQLDARMHTYQPMPPPCHGQMRIRNQKREHEQIRSQGQLFKSRKTACPTCSNPPNQQFVYIHTYIHRYIMPLTKQTTSLLFFSSSLRTFVVPFARYFDTSISSS